MNRIVFQRVAFSVLVVCAITSKRTLADEPTTLAKANAEFWKKLDGRWYEVYPETKEPPKDQRLEWHITKPERGEQEVAWFQVTDFANEAQQYGYKVHLDATHNPIWLDLEHGRAVFGREGIRVGIVKIEGDRFVWEGKKASLADWKRRKGQLPERPDSFKDDQWGTLTLKRILD